MQNPMAKLVLDYWYKAIICIGGFIFVLNGAGLLPAYPTGATAGISAGLFFWGVGEWINHPYQERLLLNNFNQPYAKLSGYLRNPRPIGILFDVFAAVLIGIGVFKLF